MQTVPLDKDGLKRILQMVNNYAMPKPLSDDLLKKAFEKWWPDLQAQLEEMRVSEQPPGKSSRSTSEMLDEILTIVRSIDKVTNRSLVSFPLVPSLAPETGFPEITGTYLPRNISTAVKEAQHFTVAAKEARIFSEAAKEAQKLLGEQLKQRLVAEVQKTDPNLAGTLEAADERYDGETLTLTLKHVVPKHRLAPVKGAAIRVGIKGLGIIGELLEEPREVEPPPSTS
jgi:hypothetical protein